jgi:hypothetical protein
MIFTILLVRECKKITRKTAKYAKLIYLKKKTNVKRKTAVKNQK